jgi:hypothetical protein
MFGAVLATVSALSISQFAGAVPLAFVYPDGPTEGFNDPTLGAVRKAAFENACHIWADQLAGTVPLSISAEFNPLPGNKRSAVLGAAGPAFVERDFAGSIPDTWYSVAQANHLSNSDTEPTGPDIEAVFNSNVDNPKVLGDISWYYGLDSNAGPNIDFRSVVLHEVGHGLGFLDLINPKKGTFFFPSGEATPLPDIYSRLLTQATTASPGDPLNVPLTAMTDKVRKKALKSNQIRWFGAGVVAAQGGNLVQMFAPKKFLRGSSISHWDPSNSPDLLMEPFFTDATNNVDITKQAFQDMGYIFIP